MYATTYVGFQYLRSGVDKYAGKFILDTIMYLKCMSLKNVPASYGSFVICSYLSGVKTYFLKQ